jgi:hypothetical protein
MPHMKALAALTILAALLLVACSAAPPIPDPVTPMSTASPLPTTPSLTPTRTPVCPNTVPGQPWVCLSAGPSLTHTPTPDLSAYTGQYSVYRDKRYPFEFEYPSVLNHIAPDCAPAVCASTDCCEYCVHFAENTLVYVFPGANITLEEFVDQWAEDSYAAYQPIWTKTQRYYSPIGQAQDIPAITFVDAFGKSVFVWHDSQIYALLEGNSFGDCNVPEAGVYEHEEFAHLLATFRFVR